MRWRGRIFTVVACVLVMVFGVPRVSEIGGFLIYVVCTVLLAAALGPALCNFAAAFFADLLYSTQGSSAPADINDTTTFGQSQNVFSLLRTISFLTLAAAMYGIFWSAPILLQWPPIDSLTVMPPRLLAALGVGIVSVLVWVFYLGVYFIPEVYVKLRDLWWSWRYPVEELPRKESENPPLPEE